jgi:DNA-binding response OmpR family regulator
MDVIQNPILIIEDDKEILTMLSMFLGQNGFEAHTAVNGTDGLRMAMNGSYCCVLLDLMLP